MPRPPSRLPLLQPWSLLLTLALGAGMAGGCARPYKGPKTVAGIGASLLAGSAAIWVVGERTDSRTLTQVGAASAAAGAGVALGAGGWLAAAASCNSDPDCPDDEVCREIPAPPGREPYRQCTPR